MSTASNTCVNRFCIPLSSEDVSNAPRMVIKYCELCRISFCTTKIEAFAPGDFIGLQRSAGHRPPLVCDKCAADPIRSLGFWAREAQEMAEIARAQNLAKQIREDQRSYRTHAISADSSVHKAQAYDNSQKKARVSWAKWRIPLMEALKEKGELTAKMIAGYVTGNFELDSTAGANALVRARRVGIPIVVVRVEGKPGQSNWRKWYGLSSAPIETLEPLNTPPQDPETHQFMKEQPDNVADCHFRSYTQEGGTRA